MSGVPWWVPQWEKWVLSGHLLQAQGAVQSCFWKHLTLSQPQGKENILMLASFSVTIVDTSPIFPVMFLSVLDIIKILLWFKLWKPHRDTHPRRDKTSGPGHKDFHKWLFFGFKRTWRLLLSIQISFEFVAGGVTKLRTTRYCFVLLMWQKSSHISDTVTDPSRYSLLGPVLFFRIIVWLLSLQ